MGVLVNFKCNELVTCICPQCYKAKQDNETKRYSRQTKEHCKQMVIEFLRERPNNYYSVPELSDFLKWDYTIVNLAVKELQHQLLMIYLERGKDGRRVRCFALK